MKVLINIDGKIKNVFDGNSLGIPIIDTDIIKNVPDTFEGKELDDIRMWNSNWVMLSAEEIIAKGYAILTPEQKIVDHKIVNKTLQKASFFMFAKVTEPLTITPASPAL